MYLAGLHRRRLHRRRGLRVRVAARPPRPLPPHRARGHARVRLAGRRRCRSWSATGRRATSPRRSRSSWRRSRACSARGGRAVHDRRLLRRRQRRDALRDPGAEAALAARRPRPQRRGDRARLRAGGGPPARQHRALVVPGHGRDRHRARAARHDLLRHLAAAAATAALALVLPRRDGGRAAVDGGDDRGLDHHRGRAPAVDRLRDDAHRRRRSPRPTGSRSPSRCSSPSTSASGPAWCGCCGGSRGARRKRRSRADAAGAVRRPRDPRRDRLRGARRRRLRRRLLGPHGRRRRARRRGAGDGAALDEPGVGGQPRVADLRARDGVDGVPGRVRLDLLDAVDPALPGGAGDHLPRRRVRAARAGGDDERGARAGRAVRAQLGAGPVLPRRRRSAASPPGGSRSATPRATPGARGSTRPRC